MTRTDKIKHGKLWQVHYDESDDVLFEGTRTACFKFLKEKRWMHRYKIGEIRVGEVIFEFTDEEREREIM